MERQHPSIFNDILGPVMVGPSSSHTCAPSRIGYTCRQLVHGPLQRVTIEFAREGAYTLSYRGQRSDMGFINGLLGHRPENPALRNAYAELKKSGVEIRFVISNFPPVRPNISHITLESQAGEHVVAHTDSTGAGTFRILKIDDFDVDIVGDCYELLIRADLHVAPQQELSQKIFALFPEYEAHHVAVCHEKALIQIKLRRPCPEELRARIQSFVGVTDILQVQPVLKVLSNRHVAVPFQSAGQMLELAERSGQDLAELAIAYEMARSGMSRLDVLEETGTVIDIMENSACQALQQDVDMHGIVPASGKSIRQYMQQGGRFLDMGVLNTAVPWSMAAMEYSNSMGVVVCAPTGGSAGVFPGAILGVAHHLGLGREEKIRAMLVTAITGIVMSKDYNYSAELYGCQVEPGAASAMAAAGLVWLLGGTARQSLDAASCAVQNILGTICDPVAGLVQIPCINRNAMSTANAVVSANIVLGGFSPQIPLDEAAETLFRVGMQLPEELRCTCRGGLCTTCTGQRLAREQDARNARLQQTD